jgi:BirA family biotin operon repressor/biotin-[acetyl-CoA-carboxylase] ligase
VENHVFAAGAAVPADLEMALDGVRPRLRRIGSSLLFFPTIGSTNDEAMSKVRDGASSEGLVVVADRQTAGRGRRGHTWFSPPGSGLYVSVVLMPSRAADEPARATMLLTLAAGVALAEALDTAAGVAVRLKWPNDLFIARRKVGGVLAERSTGGGVDAVVLGYGINVGAASFPPELTDVATSLETELGHAVDRGRVFAATLAALDRRYDDLLAGRFDAILQAWRQRAPAAIGSRVTFAGASGPVSGITAGIADDGALLVKAGDAVERIVSGPLVWE